MLRDALIVGVGGFVGAVARYIVSGLVQDNFNFPVGTLFVNVVGSFLLSFLMYSTEYAGYLAMKREYF